MSDFTEPLYINYILKFQFSCPILRNHYNLINYYLLLSERNQRKITSKEEEESEYKADLLKSIVKIQVYFKEESESHAMKKLSEFLLENYKGEVSKDIAEIANTYISEIFNKTEDKNTNNLAKILNGLYPDNLGISVTNKGSESQENSKILYLDTVIIPAGTSIDFIKKNYIYFCPKDRNYKIGEGIKYMAFYANKEIQFFGEAKLIDNKPDGFKFPDYFWEAKNDPEGENVQFYELSNTKELSIKHNKPYALVQNRIYTTKKSLEIASTTDDIDRE